MRVTHGDLGQDEFALFDSRAVWEPKFRKVHLPTASELKAIIDNHLGGVGKWGPHRNAHAYYTWYHASLNNGVIPIGVRSVFQNMHCGQQMFTKELQEVITEYGLHTFDVDSGVERLLNSRAFLNLLRVSLGFRLIEVADSPAWYSFSQDMVYSLLATDIGTISKELRLPYPAIILEFPEGIFRCMMRGIEYSIRSAIIAEEGVWGRGAKGRKAFIISATLASTDPRSWGVANAPHFLISRESETQPGMWDVPSLGAGAHLTGDLVSDVFVGAQKVSDEKFISTFDRLLWLAVLYLSSADNDVKRVENSRTKRKRKKGKRGIPQSRARQWALGEEYVVGSTVKAHPLIKRAALEGVSTAPTAIAYAHAVRGHFKMQPCGARRLDRKRIWVQPYVRNSEVGGPVVGHTYQVD